MLTAKQKVRTKLTKDVAVSIARAYCANKRDKAQALLDNGYSESYARSGRREVVFRNVHVIEAIAEIEAVLSEKCVWDALESERKLQETYDFAKTCKQPPAMVSAVATLNKLKGFDKAVDTTEQPAQLSQADLEVLRTLARAVTDKGLKGPQLAQDERKVKEA